MSLARASTSALRVRGRLLSILLALGLMVLPACPREGGQSKDGGAPGREGVNLSFESYSLPNGLEVNLRKDDRVPIAAVNLWYHVGPANEDRHTRGFAHLLEHIMVQGSSHVPANPFFYLEAAGASAFNGLTDLDRTAYLADVPSNQLELALWLESDRMGFMLDALDEGDFRNQQSVVRNERRQTIEAVPYQLGQEEVYHLLFPEDHPYHANVIGSHGNIQAATLPGVREFFKLYYGPNNASLSIVGNIDIRKTKALVEKYFGSIPRGPEVDKPRIETPLLTREHRKTLTDAVALPRVYIAWVTPPAFTNEDATATLSGRLLGLGKASRLYRRLVYELKVAESVFASQRSLAHGSVFQIEATAKPGHTADQLEEAIDAELDELARSGPGDRELEATKRGFVAGAVKSLEPFGGVADRLNAYNHYVGNSGFINEDLDRYDGVSARGVRDFVAKHLPRDRRVVVHVVPGPKVLPPEPPSTVPPTESGTRPATQSREQWRYDVPKSSSAPRIRLPSVHRFRLSNGLPVYLAQSHSLPLVTAYLTSKKGSAADPRELPGLSAFSSSMLDEGTGSRSAVDIANDVAYLGLTLETGSSKEESWVYAESLKGQFRESAALMRDVILAPAFLDSEIERVRSDRLAALQRERDEPLTIANKVMWRELYGHDHPYAHLALGTEEALRKIRKEDLVQMYEQSFSPATSALILSGDLTRAEARRLAEDTLGDWTGGGEFERPHPDPTPSQDRVLVVNRPGSPQTTLLVAQLGAARQNPDFERLQLVNRILGNLFSSRINLSLRQVHGYTYRASSDLAHTRGVGPLYISAPVDAEYTGESVREVLAEVQKLRDSGVTNDEIAAAKESMKQLLPARFQTNGSAARALAGLFILDLPANYYHGLEGRLAPITTSEVSEVAKLYLHPGEMKIIAVGDLDRIGRELQALGSGMSERTADGLPPPSS